MKDNRALMGIRVKLMVCINWGAFTHEGKNVDQGRVDLRHSNYILSLYQNIIIIFASSRIIQMLVNNKYMTVYDYNTGKLVSSFRVSRNKIDVIIESPQFDNTGFSYINYAYHRIYFHKTILNK